MRDPFDDGSVEALRRDVRRAGWLLILAAVAAVAACVVEYVRAGW